MDRSLYCMIIDNGLPHGFQFWRLMVGEFQFLIYLVAINFKSSYPCNFYHVKKKNEEKSAKSSN